MAEKELAYDTTAGRWVLLATILGSGVASLDATIVNVALPRIGEDLDAELAGLQWTLNGYLLSLATLILLGGALGDRYGRRRIFVIGVVWFALASLVCGLAPNIELLVAARVLQGVGGALLTPGSLAILQASFAPGDRARAIGAWSGFGGLTAAMGPFLGGSLVDGPGWRWAFLLNLPLAAVVVVVTRRHVPETRDPTTSGSLDIAGAAVGAVGLAGTTYALIEGATRGATSPVILVATIGGLLALAAFVAIERQSSHPMLPVDIFSSRQFTAANVVTLLVYAAIGGTFFLLVLQLQVVLGYSALASGSALFPVTILMLLLSARAGQLAQRIGPRLPMSLGPVVAGVGLLLMVRIEAGAGYLTAVVPAAVVFGLGLSLMVAPLTATVLAAADAHHAGIASGVNNAVARVGGLAAIAVLPLVAGLTGEAYQNPALVAEGFRTGIFVTAGLCVAGGLLAFATIRNETLQPRERPKLLHQDRHCAVDGTPLRPAEPIGVSGPA